MRDSLQCLQAGAVVGGGGARTVVRDAIAGLEHSSEHEVGLLMKPLMARHKGRIDGKLVLKIAGETLAQG